MARDLKKAHAALVAHALSFPGAWKDTPWEGDVVAKVGKKIFVFFGTPLPKGLGLGVKLPQEGEFARSLPFCEPMGYGLGRSGWVSVSFKPGDDVPLDMLKEWMDESYRAVAPKKLIKELDARS
jgi:predicted DNA-binding protein (MmcQ/YjbR family)